MTIGFARRDATYKRGDLVFRDLDRFKHIAATGGRIQIIYAGKAHPNDQGGKEVIQRIFQARDALKTHVKIAYMVNYDWQLAQLMTAGVDVWLNTPEPPLEASGTSGMKAALNGVPSSASSTGGGSKAASKGSRAGPSADCRYPATGMKTDHRATPLRSTTSWSGWSFRSSTMTASDHTRREVGESETSRGTSIECLSSTNVSPVFMPAAPG